MTDISTSRSPTAEGEPTAAKLKDEARDMGRTAADAGGSVVETTKEQASEVVAETKRQARSLYGEATTELRNQAGTQQQRAAEGLRSLGGEIRSMAESGGSGPATELAHRASQAVDRAAGWLEGREPGRVLDDIRQYARQHPGAFLAGAAVLGVLAGRLTRGLAASTDTASDSAATPNVNANPTTTYTSAPPVAASVPVTPPHAGNAARRDYGDESGL